MINTVEDARAFVSVAKYPPVGERSWGPHRAMTLGNIPDQKTYLRDANQLTVTFAMIETRTALANLDAIAATEGIDALFVGPSDLSIALGNGADVDPHDAAVEKELDRIVAAADKAKKKIVEYFNDNFHITVSGNFCTPALLTALMTLGAGRILFSTDWPFENVDHAANWFDAVAISEADRLKIGRTNAIKLFKLDMK